MKLFLFFALFNFYFITVNAQINASDSSFQVISYFNKLEKQSYAVTTDKYRVIGNDSSRRETISYEVDVTVLDSSAKEYTIEWFYKNFVVLNSEGDETMKRLASIANNCKVIYKTDELGVFKEVVNWKEVRNFMQSSFESLKKEFKEQTILDNVYDLIKDTYSSKEAIESVAIQDIIQFHSFYGAQYKIGEELSGNTQVPNVYGNKPFDAQFTAYLDELNFEDLNGILRYTQVVDKTQLSDATYQFLCEIAKKANTEKPKREEVQDISNEVSTGSRIHTSGWVIYSIQTKLVSSGKVSNVEERTIEIK